MDPCKGGIDFFALDLSKLWTTPPAKIKILGPQPLIFNTLKLSYMLYLTKMRATYVINYTRVQFDVAVATTCVCVRACLYSIAATHNRHQSMQQRLCSPSQNTRNPKAHWGGNARDSMVHVHICSSLSFYVLSYLSRPKLPNASFFLLHHDLVYHQVSHATRTQKLPCRYADMHEVQARQNINTNTTNVGRFVNAFGFRYFSIKC